MLLEYRGDYRMWLKSGVNPEPYPLAPGETRYMDVRDRKGLSPEWREMFIEVVN